jgi:hypothetical protein
MEYNGTINGRQIEFHRTIEVICSNPNVHFTY